MIPKFPEFKKLEISDRSEIESITSKYPPYSDFNFTSMYCWDTSGDVRVSTLNNNLVVIFTDYITNEKFLSFLGNLEVNDTTEKTLGYSHEKFGLMSMKLIPKSVIEELSNQFEAVEDRDNFDYLYDLSKLSSYDGNQLRSKRNLCNRFMRSHVAEVRYYTSFTDELEHQINDLFKKWVANKNLSEEDAHNEEIAIKRLFNLWSCSDAKFIVTGLFSEGILIGFVINERISDDEVILHFEKADEGFVGVYAYLMMENAKILNSFGIKILNYEQDLGIDGLRLGKRSYRPIAFLEKYTVSLPKI